MTAGEGDGAIDRVRALVRGRRREALRRLFLLATAVGPSPGRQRFDRSIRRARAQVAARRARSRGKREGETS